MSLDLKEMIRIGAKQLEDAGVCDSEFDAKELYCFMTGLDRVGLLMNWQESVPDNRVDRYFELIEERAKRVPLQHITGVQEFMGFKFKVSDAVLIPRQDTETLVEDVISLIEKQSLRGEKYLSKRTKITDILDLCTGSGAIGISLSKLTKGTKVTCSDISEEAISIARENAEDNDARGIKFIVSDMFFELKGAFGKKKFDLIVSNPPYIEKDVIETLEPEVRDHEPRIALDGGDDGLDFYKRIAEEAPEHMNKSAVLIMEIGFNQGESVSEILREQGLFENIVVLKDLTGKDRIVAAIYNQK